MLGGKGLNLPRGTSVRCNIAVYNSKCMMCIVAEVFEFLGQACGIHSL